MSTPLCRDSHQTNPWYKAIYFACFFALDVPLYKQRGGFAFRTLEVVVACCRVGYLSVDTGECGGMITVKVLLFSGKFDKKLQKNVYFGCLSLAERARKC